VRSGATEVFRRIVGRTGFPAISSVQGWGVVDPTRADYIGSPGWHAGDGAIRAGREADVILAVGCKFGSWIPVAKPPAVNMADGQKIIQIDIDNEMLGKNAPVALGMVGDARETLLLLESMLTGDKLAIDRSWVDSLVASRAEYLTQVNQIADAGAAPGEGPPATPSYMRKLASLIPKDTIVCVDGGQTSSWAMTFLESQRPGLAKFESGMGHMGAGLPMAIGAKAATGPDQRVVVICGDGAAGLTSQELETASRMGMQLIVLVFNDSAWGCYKPLEQFVFRNPRFGTTLKDTDFSAVAKAYGCTGERVTTVEELTSAFERALASDQTYVIDVVTSYAFHPLDPVFFGQVIAGGVQLQPHTVETVL
jgi:acetolactate synthase I/II/III large subunit